VIPQDAEFMAWRSASDSRVDGQARDIMEQAQAGIFVELKILRALTTGHHPALWDSDLRRTLGKNGRDYIVSNLSRHKTAQVYSMRSNVVQNGTREAKPPSRWK